jgi:hypothetical protein
MATRGAHCAERNGRGSNPLNLNWLIPAKGSGEIRVFVVFWINTGIPMRMPVFLLKEEMDDGIARDFGPDAIAG